MCPCCVLASAALWLRHWMTPCWPPPIPLHGSASEVNSSSADAQVVSCHRYLIVFHPFVEQLTVFHTSGLVLASSSILRVLDFDLHRDSLVPRPHLRERGSGDIRLIPRASLTLITFWREISLRQSHCRKDNL